jgi:hypothetical protein
MVWLNYIPIFNIQQISIVKKAKNQVCYQSLYCKEMKPNATIGSYFKVRYKSLDTLLNQGL